jgi:hypothetical protein
MAKESRLFNWLAMEVCEMQRADIVLSILSQKSFENRKFIWNRVYRNLFNKDLYAESISKNTTSSITEDSIQEIIDALKHEKLNEIFTSNQKVQMIVNVMCNILRAIYNPLFLGEYKEHSLKINQSHFLFLKMRYIKEKFKTNVWFLKMKIEMNASEFINSQVVFFMGEKIKDQRFLLLVEKILKWMKENPNKEETKRFTDLLLEILYLSFLSNDEREKEAYCIHKNEMIRPLDPKKNDLSKTKKDAEDFIERFQREHKKNQVSLLNIQDKGMEFANFIVKRRSKDQIDLLIPYGVIHERLKPFLKNEKPVHHNRRLQLSVEKIHQEFEKDLKELKENYDMTENYNIRIRKFKYYHQLSFLKTIARKEKTSVKKVKKKYKKTFKYESN